MVNRENRPAEATLFLNKLDILLDKLRIQYQNGTFRTQEEVLEEFSRVLKQFYATLKAPALKLRPVRAESSPSNQNYNASFEEIGQDLAVIFKELNHLESVILKNFNYMVSERDKVNKFLKRVSSKVGDYILYSNDPIGNVLYFKDSFNDTSKIDFASPLLKEDQCAIHQAEGIITLPAQNNTDSAIRKVNIRINTEHSNGTQGNNQQLGAKRHNNLNDIVDNNPDTWFEYERVQRSLSSDDLPLKLDLTLYFDAPTVINFIKINPNNFGTQTPVAIKTLDTSYDGHVWVSVKDDIPIAGFLQEDEENIFTLAPSTSKYAGQGLYTFTPRKVKYIHVLLQQDTPYQIETAAGTKWRYAIGIRDIELHAIKYATTGDIISQPFSSALEIQRVSLLGNENPTEVSNLADVTHQISPDDGATWYSIQPQQRSGTKTPEILEFNTGGENGISTPTPVNALRHRMLLERHPDQFKKGSSTLKRTIKHGVDILTMPTTSPIKLNLTRSPVAGTVSVMNPVWGARSGQGSYPANKLILGISNGQSGQRIIIPGPIVEKIRSGELDINKDITIWVDEDPDWERVATWEDAADIYDRVFIADIRGEEGVIQFGSGNNSTADPYDLTASKGAVPPAGSYIGLSLGEEYLLVSPGSPHRCTLLFPSDGDKDSLRIFRMEEATTDTDRRVASGAKVHRLPHSYIDLTSGITSSDPAFTNQQDYVDGSSELVSPGDYSIDSINGIVYTYDETSKTTSPLVTYSYVPVTELSKDDWYFEDNSSQRIVIRDTGYNERTGSISLKTHTGERVLDLDYGDGCVVPGSIKGIVPSIFTQSGSDTPIPLEVEFQDGVKEFPLPSSTEVDTSGYYSVDYRHGKMYFAGSISGSATTELTFSYTQLLAVYNIAQMLEKDKYTVDTSTSTISIAESEALKLWTDRNSTAKNDSLVKVSYDYVETTRESIEELEPYFSPIVRDYVIKVLPKGAV